MRRTRQPNPSLDAGSTLRLDTPGGTSYLSITPINGQPYPRIYSGTEVKAGEYAASNGAGGQDVAQFQASAVLPEIAFSWSNQGTIQLKPDSPLQVSWERGDPEGYVMIEGIIPKGGILTPNVI